MRGTGAAASSAAVRLERIPSVAGMRPADAAEHFRDLPGLVLLESARPGRNARWSFLTADPLAVLNAPSDGADPFAEARATLRRVAPAASSDDGAPTFLGGLAGYLSYDLGRRFERLPSLAVDDQPLPLLRLALHDWVVAWDRRTGTAWLGGRAVDGDTGRLERRLAEVRERLARKKPADRDGVGAPPEALQFTSGLDRPAYEAGVEAIRERIARGDLYQANLTRRLETSFASDA